MTIEYKFEESPMVCRIKDEGTTGQYYGKVHIGDKYWGLVLLDERDEPDMYETQDIEVGHIKWMNAREL